MIAGRVLDVLYGSNLGCDDTQDVFNLASQVLQIEQQLSEAQRAFPPSLQLVEPKDLVKRSGTSSDAIMKFRVVYTLRYHNIRILTHRPLLHRYLEILSSQTHDPQKVVPLGQLGVNSLRTCIQSAGSIVELMSSLTSYAEGTRELLGAWWFSLYYSKAPVTESFGRLSNTHPAFNAALVLYSGLLIQAYANTHEGLLSLGDVSIKRELLRQAIQCLMSLDKDNPMTEKCARYTSKLDQVLSVLGELYLRVSSVPLVHVSADFNVPDSTQPLGNNGTPANANPLSHAAPGISSPRDAPDLFDLGNTPSGLDLSEFMVPGDLDFLNAFDMSRVAF